MRFVLAPLAVLLLVTLVGAAKKEASRPLSKRGATVVGTAALLAAAGLLWRRRRLVLDGAAVSVVAVVVLAVGVSIYLKPERALPLIAAGVVGLCVWWMTVDRRVTGGRPWGDVLTELRRGDAAQRAIVAANPDARPGAVRVRGGRVEVAVEHVGPVDVERVGEALHAPHVELVPGAEMGRAKVVVHDQAPPPERPVWESLATVRQWPGVSSLDPSAPIPVAVDPFGGVVSIPVPGEGGKHLLVAGSTGAGKSKFLSVVLAELAHRDAELRLADPKLVEFGRWRDRAVIAKGADATGDMLDATCDDMMARYQELEAEGLDVWPGRRMYLVIDELAAVTTGNGRVTGPRIQKLGLILAMGRAAGVGLIVCTQRPSKDVIPLDLRDNTRVRVGLGCESGEQTKMIMGSNIWPCEDIPESLPGTAYVRVDRHATLCRSFLVTSADVDRVAAATAHLKGA